MNTNCVMCGAPFPPGTPPARKYCYECLKIRHLQQARETKARRRERREKKVLEPTPETIKKADRAYCRKCIYANTHTETHLCNYIFLTGELRGGKAGVGCEKRRLR